MNSIPLDWPILVTILWAWGIIVGAALITPRCSRPDLFFAVTVQPSFRQSPTGRRILRRYDGSVVVVTLFTLLLVILVMRTAPAWKQSALSALVFVEMAGWFGAFLAARRRTLPHHVEPDAEREAQLQPRRVSLPGNWLGQIGPFLILGAICLGLWWRWDDIPARIPIRSERRWSAQ